ncbi:glycosyltransferase family 61 protein [Methylorubrum thiocyanatum]|uniref:glycosyltransferase family 61 protein n=1 Tax=Methylorubrum thiocyanatum TaxID=47958 RepID=UPI003F7E1AA8
MSKPALVRCRETFGTVNLRHGDPATRTAFDVIYTPFRRNERWGIFDERKKAIEACIDYREPHYQLMYQAPIYPDGIVNIPWAPHERYIYGGRFNPHYGHYLVESLPRLWRLAREGLAGRKIIMHGEGDLTWWFSYDHVRTAWGGLGLSQDDFVHFDHPVKIRELTIPLPSLQQQTYAHPVYGELCRKIGQSIIEVDSARARNTTPVFLSKTKLSGGVNIIVGEDIVEEKLAAEGVDIVHPQDLSLQEQIALFSDRETIVGTAGSAFHTSVFSSRPSRQIALSPIHSINANYVLFDKLALTETEQYYQVGSYDIGGDERFLTRRKLADPEVAAADLIGIIRDGPQEV